MCSLRIAMLLTTGGLFRGFLGFKFGKKEEKKEEDPLLRAFKEAKTAQIKRDFKTAEVQFHEALKVKCHLLFFVMNVYKKYNNYTMTEQSNDKIY